jgi:hypothetical protein
LEVCPGSSCLLSLIDSSSLAVWVAYWTVGYKVSVQWYFRRLQGSISSLIRASKLVLPTNRRSTSKFLSQGSFRLLEDFLSGPQDDSIWSGSSRLHYSTTKFVTLIQKDEKEMKATLDELRYIIDEDNTLTKITRGDRPEKVCTLLSKPPQVDVSQYALPLLNLLLRRCIFLLSQARTKIIPSSELDLVSESISFVLKLLSTRVLQICCKLSISPPYVVSDSINPWST